MLPHPYLPVSQSLYVLNSVEHSPEHESLEMNFEHLLIAESIVTFVLWEWDRQWEASSWSSWLLAGKQNVRQNVELIWLKVGVSFHFVLMCSTLSVLHVIEACHYPFKVEH